MRREEWMEGGRWSLEIRGSDGPKWLPTIFEINERQGHEQCDWRGKEEDEDYDLTIYLIFTILQVSIRHHHSYNSD